jgi:hypothetical protein
VKLIHVRRKGYTMLVLRRIPTQPMREVKMPAETAMIQVVDRINPGLFSVCMKPAL